MGPKTKLLILDRVMPERFEASPLAESHALLHLTMMMFTGGGRERTAKQFEALVVWRICDLNALYRCVYRIASSKLSQTEGPSRCVGGNGHRRY
jgi:hypothetical protein